MTDASPDTAGAALNITARVLPRVRIRADEPEPPAPPTPAELEFERASWKISWSPDDVRATRSNKIE